MSTATSRYVSDPIPAIVLKLVPHRLQHGGLGVARSLGGLGVPVHTAYVDGFAPAALSRHVVSRHRLHAGHDDAIVAQLGDIAERIGPGGVLIPADDVATLLVDRHDDALRSLYRLPEQPRTLPHRLAHKGELYRLCREHGIPAPETRFPGDLDEAVMHADELGYPVVVKSMDPAVMRTRPAASSVAIARGREELERIHAASEVSGAPNLMLQEHLPGGPQDVWMFNGYVDRCGRLPLAMTGIKLRQSPPGTGSTTLGVTRHNRDVVDTTHRFLRAIGYRGMVDMGYRFDARDGRYKLLDVNPRIGATFRLFVAANGLDVVRAQYLDLTDQPVPSDAAPDGRRWLVENADLATVLTLARKRQIGVRSWLRSLGEVDEGAWFSWSDPAPVVAMVASGWLALGRRGIRAMSNGR